MATKFFHDDAGLQTASARFAAVHAQGIEVERTIFYSLGGGQVGDTGFLVRSTGERNATVDTRRDAALDAILHMRAAGVAQPEVGEVREMVMTAMIRGVSTAMTVCR